MSDLADGVPKIPDLELANLEFLAVSADVDAETRRNARQTLLESIASNNMTPYYKKVVEDLHEPIDAALLAKMEQANAEELKKLEEKLNDATQNLGETEISDALAATAYYLSKIGDKEKAVAAFRLAYDKTGPLGARIDLLFAVIRIGLFFKDNDLISRDIDKVKDLIEEGGDWDRRNRLKVYRGLYLISIRDFKGAVNLFLDTLATFTSTEVMEYKDFVRYAVLTAAITLERPEFKKKVVNAPEILEVLHEIPNLEQFAFSLYRANYSQFFTALALVEQSLKRDRMLAAHYRYYIREMRIKAYNQLLQSYRSVTIALVAQSFGVSEEYIDADLSRFIASGRIQAVIDKVGGVVETNRADGKNRQYVETIRNGDALLNKIQKLGRVINV
ncbi:26S proteasome subunit RPN7-domain-containing protein [Cladochytrium replicatum]|nr:26S proteasome subunit RPN7-domain-containing protein [Cladochytrium replicatum]